MFIASYNATHTAEAIATYKAIEEHSEEDLVTTQIDCMVLSDTVYGYKVRMGQGEMQYGIAKLGNESILDNSIYCPSNCFCWLASPSDGIKNNVMLIGNLYRGILSNDGYQVYCGIRPLVCIPLSRIGTGAGKIEIGDF